jgi:hypothetical protein
MPNSLKETFTMPARNYAALALKYCKQEQEKSMAEKPRAKDLSDKLTVLVEQAKSENLTLDDDGVAKSPRAAEIRAEIDKILPEFTELQQAAAKRISMTRHFSKKVTELKSKCVVEVDVPLGEALVLLNLAEPGFTKVTQESV